MKTILIPGFAIKSFIFEDFRKNLNFIDILDLKEFTYKETADALFEISENNEKIKIIGWSLGSLFALKWTIENPQFVDSLFLTGATPCFTENETYKNTIKRATVERMIKFINGGRKTIILNDFYNNCFFYVNEKEQIIKSLMEDGIEEENLINGLNELLSINLIDNLKNIKVKTTIYHGENDSITPIYGSEVLHNNISNSILIRYSGGHSYFFEKSLEAERVLKDFANG